MPRLFVGLELPDEIAEVLTRLQQPLPGARWIERSDLHLTLRFFGDVEPPVAREIAYGLSEISQPLFELKLSEPGAFGGDDPHSVWAGVDGGEALDQLQRATERVARHAGLKPERHPFRPHVTLARLRNSRADAVAKWLQRHGGFRSESFLISQFVLFSARAHVGGGPYGKDEVFPLLGAGWQDEDDPEEFGHGAWPAGDDGRR